MASFVPKPVIGKKVGRRTAVGSQTRPLRTSVHRVPMGDAEYRIAHSSYIPEYIQTSTNSTRKTSMKDERSGKTTQTERMPKKQRARIEKVMGNAKSLIDNVYPQKRFSLGPAIFSGAFVAGSHDTNNYAQQIVQGDVKLWPDIHEYLELRQTGKDTLSTLFKDQKSNKFYTQQPGIAYVDGEIDSALNAGTSVGDRIPLKSVCGYNRTGVFNPLAFLDWAQTSPAANLTSSNCGQQNVWATGGRSQILDAITLTLRQWYLASGALPPTKDALVTLLQNYVAGMSSNSSLTFPLEEINDVFTFRNENAVTPAYLSLYHCTPKRDIGIKHNPITDWYDFQLGGGLPQDIILDQNSEAIKADSKYAFKPVMSQYANDFVAVTKSATNTAQIANMDSSNWNRVTALATEVVPQNTPFLSQQFKDNWSVINNKKIILQPGQELKIHVKVKYVRPIDLRALLLGQGRYYFESMTYYPILKFWGEENTMQVKLQETVNQRNRLRSIQKAESGPVLLMGQKEGTATVAGSMPPEMKSNYQPTVAFQWLNNFFGQMESNVRDILNPTDAPHEYGLDMAWPNINNNAALFGVTTDDQTQNDPVTTAFTFSNTATTDWETSGTQTASYQGDLAQSFVRLGEISVETDVQNTLVGTQVYTSKVPINP